MPNLKADLFLVTGAAGFVGGHLLELLRMQGVKLRAMVRKGEQAQKLRAAGYEVVVADLADQNSLRLAVDGVSGVFHIASIFRQAGLPESVFNDVNAVGTQRLLDAAIDAGVKRFIHCSTVGVHGHVEKPPANENAPFKPGDMYQRTKLAGEQIATKYFSAGKISGVVIRPAMIWGPGDLRTLKLFRMIAKQKFFYVGSGSGQVHFVDVRDLARAFLSAMQHNELNAKVYIIAGRTSLSLSSLCEKIADVLEVNPPWLRLPVKPMQWLGTLCEIICTPFGVQPPIFRRRVDFFTKDRCFDASNAHKDLEFSPMQTLEAEISDIVSWYKSEGLLPRDSDVAHPGSGSESNNDSDKAVGA